MGFFSWNCRGCGHPMLSDHKTNKINGWMRDVVVVESDGRLLMGDYDGYGRLTLGDDDDSASREPIEINHMHGGGDYGEPGCWHRACWLVAGRPTGYAPSESSVDQGFFFGDEHDLEEPGHCERTLRVVS